MSARHPIIFVTGSSGAGTTSVRNIFGRERIAAVYVESDAFHRHDHAAMARLTIKATSGGDNNSICIPGNKLDLAMQLILTPIILQLMERRRKVS